MDRLGADLRLGLDRLGLDRIGADFRLGADLRLGAERCATRFARIAFAFLIFLRRRLAFDLLPEAFAALTFIRIFWTFLLASFLLDIRDDLLLLALRDDLRIIIEIRRTRFFLPEASASLRFLRKLMRLATSGVLRLEVLAGCFLALGFETVGATFFLA